MAISQSNTDIKVKKSTIMSLLKNDNSNTAEAINLKYVTNKEKGISRKRKGQKFSYFADGKVVNDKDTLDRIKKLVIPPAWNDVWISKSPEGHLQATGIDAANRKQYLYHPLWNSIRSQTKFFHLYQFGKALPEQGNRSIRDW